ncbi:MAG: dihydrolipoyl dehydrogenase [Candidatus Norongarragalinales archaeon]
MVVGDIPDAADVVVIGAGPGGYVAAIRAAQLGKSVMLVEKDKLGGLCLNYGCIPSKALIHASQVLEDLKHTQNMGISASGVEFTAEKMQEWRQSVIKKLRDGIAFLMKKNGVEVKTGEAFFESSSRAGIRTEHGVELVDFKKAIIATGSKPRAVKGFEFDGQRIISSKEALELKQIPKRMVVIGGGYIGIELGGMYAKLGSSVTIVEGLPSILAFAGSDMVGAVKKRLAALNVKILENTNALNAEKQGQNVKVKLSQGGKEILEEADVVLVCVGHTPVTQNIALEKTKVQLDEKGFVKINDKLQTTDANIYAVGDVTGNPMLAHKAFRQGKLAAEIICGEETSFNNRTVPSVIFSDPEIAIVGLTEREAKAELQDNILVGKFPLSASGRALTLGTQDGFVKVIAKKDSHELVGIEIVGPSASDLIGEAGLAIELGAMLEDVAATIHPHPTLCEGLSEAAEDALGKAIHV